METRIRGLLETQRNLEKVAADLDGEPMVRAMRDATLLIAADAKRNAPVDTGRLKSIIHPEIRRERVLQGVVGSVVKYAPYVETGTRPHMPPPAALQTWARRTARAPGRWPWPSGRGARRGTATCSARWTPTASAFSGCSMRRWGGWSGEVRAGGGD
jgi:hypothetical protein